MSNNRSKSKVLDRKTVKQISRSLLYSLRNHSNSLKRIATTIRRLGQVARTKRDYHRIKRKQQPILRIQQLVVPKAIVAAAIQKNYIQQKIKQQLRSQPQQIQVIKPVPIEQKANQIVSIVQNNPQLDLVAVQNAIMNQPILGDGINPAPPPVTELQKIIAQQTNGLQTAQITSDIV